MRLPDELADFKFRLYSTMVEYRSKLLVVCALAGLIGILGCSSAPGQLSNEEHDALEQAEVDRVPTSTEVVETPVKSYSGENAEVLKRLDLLEEKLASLNDKFNTTRVFIEAALNKTTATSQPTGHPADNVGVAPTKVPSPTAVRTAATGFVSDEAVQKYREAKALYDGQKYNEALLEFGEFLRDHADHPLAGSAQFFLGESYFQQKEWRLAKDEYQRVLVSYDSSPHISDTLARLHTVNENLQITKDAERNKQLLLSLFPLSPAARFPAEAGKVAPEPSKVATSTSAPPVEPLPEAAPAVSDPPIFEGD